MRLLKCLIAVSALSSAFLAVPTYGQKAEQPSGESSGRAVEREEMLAAAQAIYAPYQDGSFFEGGAWDRPIYSQKLNGLIAEWQAGTSDDEVEELNSFDWLCQCQDFDPENFSVQLEPEILDDPVGSVNVRLNLGWDTDETQDSMLFMTKEDGRWVIVEIISESFPAGLQAELNWAIDDHKDGHREAGQAHD